MPGRGGGGPRFLTPPNSAPSQLGRLSQLLTEYDRVAIVDDTALIRGDAPDLFDLVPPDMLGGTIEGPEIRPAGERELFLTAACEKYTPAADCSAAAKDGVVVNTGFLILSKEVADDLFGPHRTGGAEDGWGIDIDLDLYGDQGYINALLNSPESVGRGVVDLGYEFNYVGSLETTNRDRIELRAADAYVVHATTGLMVKEVSQIEIEGAAANRPGYRHYQMLIGDEAFERRRDFLRDVDASWKADQRCVGGC